MTSIAEPRKVTVQRQRLRKPTGKSRLIALLKRRNGAKASTLCTSFGWQKHTVRAALSGLRKEGYGICTSQSVRDGTTIYRITSEPAGAL